MSILIRTIGCVALCVCVPLPALSQPIYTVTSGTADQYAQHLTSGQLKLLKRGHRLPVYQATATKREGGTFPHPSPINGHQMVLNHRFRPVGEYGYIRRADLMVFDGDGSIEQAVEGRLDVKTMPPEDPGVSRVFTFFSKVGAFFYALHTRQQSDAPLPHFRVYQSIDRGIFELSNWDDSPLPLTDATRFQAQEDGWSAEPGNYEFKAIRRAELIVPFHATRLASISSYDEYLSGPFPNPAHTRYEKRSVVVIEASGEASAFRKVNLYLDPTSWTILMSEWFDSRDELWLFVEHHAVHDPSIGATVYAATYNFDLHRGRGVASDLLMGLPLQPIDSQPSPGETAPSGLKRYAKLLNRRGPDQFRLQ